ESREIVSRQHQRRYPQQPTQTGPEQEPTLTHSSSSGNQRSERADPRNPTRRHDSQEPSAVEERPSPRQVVLVEHLRTAAGCEFRPGVSPDVVPHLISENRDDQCRTTHHPRLY